MLLAMDTATQTASIALLDWKAGAEQTDRLLAECTWLSRRRQTQDLTASVQHLLTQLELTPQALTGLAVTTGPGSFTGVRIAISAAKGMSIGLPPTVATIGLPVLSVTAAPWLAAAKNAGVQVWAYLQAGRGRLNWCIFDGIDALWRPAAEAHAAGTVEELALALQTSSAPVWLVGETTPPLFDAVCHLTHVTPIDGVSSARRAGHLAQLAARHFAHGHRDAAAALQPLYLNDL